MGTIIGSRVMDDGNVVYEIVVDPAESKQLKGQTKDIHIFSLHNSHSNSRLTRRGKNDATTYFLVPRDFREGLTGSASASCQMMKLPNRRLYIFTLEET